MTNNNEFPEQSQVKLSSQKIRSILSDLSENSPISLIVLYSVKLLNIDKIDATEKDIGKIAKLGTSATNTHLRKLCGITGESVKDPLSDPIVNRTVNQSLRAKPHIYQVKSEIDLKHIQRAMTKANIEYQDYDQSFEDEYLKEKLENQDLDENLQDKMINAQKHLSSGQELVVKQLQHEKDQLKQDNERKNQEIELLKQENERKNQEIELLKQENERKNQENELLYSRLKKEIQLQLV
ncbi:hypothetical protein ACL6C3_25585 [Capilliphycus salinus ALCB114379]|uniref:hypothetical protein n=1 Tax=Capilliphycus salinus TaxID=2768948 RepID=UPI0039A5C18F